MLALMNMSYILFLNHSKLPGKTKSWRGITYNVEIEIETAGFAIFFEGINLKIYFNAK